jgi:hypothetical protein
MIPPFTMSQSQWKAYFSMFVLGQTPPVENPAEHNLSCEWDHQSCSWYADVYNFNLKTNYFWREQFTNILKKNIKNFPSMGEYLKHVYTDDEYCRCCGYPSISYYCNFCDMDRCAGCGEIGCGSYMCHECRRADY